MPPWPRTETHPRLGQPRRGTGPSWAHSKAPGGPQPVPATGAQGTAEWHGVRQGQTDAPQKSHELFLNGPRLAGPASAGRHGCTLPGRDTGVAQGTPSTTAPPPTPHGAFPSPLGEAAEGWTTGARFAQSQPGRQVASGSRPPPRGSKVTLPRHTGPRHHGQGTAGGGFEAGDKA